MHVSAIHLYLPNLSSLSRSDFPNSLYLFAFPHFTRIPVTRLILPAFKRRQELDHTFGLDEAFPFHNLWSPRELLLSNTTVEHLLSQIINWISFVYLKTGTLYLWSMNYTLVCYGLLILGRSHSAPVAASTTASGLQAAALRTTQSKSIPASKLHRVSDQCPQSYWFPLCIKGNSYQGIFHTINTEIYGVISTFLFLSNF